VIHSAGSAGHLTAALTLTGLILCGCTSGSTDRPRESKQPSSAAPDAIVSAPPLSFRNWMNGLCSGGLSQIAIDLGELIDNPDRENRYYVLKEMRTEFSGAAREVTRHGAPARFRAEYRAKVVAPLVTLAREFHTVPGSFRRHQISIQKIAREVVRGFRPMVRFGSHHRLNDCPGSLPAISA
jgi:hypothetical protein